MDENKDKKDEEKDLNDINPEELMEELKKILDGEFDSKKEDLKNKEKKPIIKSFGIEPKVFNNIAIDLIYHVILSILINLAIFGLTSFFRVPNILLFTLSIFVYGIVNYFVRYLTFKKLFKLYLKTFGLINILFQYVVYISIFYLGSVLFDYSSSFGFISISFFITFFIRFVFDQYIRKIFNKKNGNKIFTIGGKK